MTLGEYIKNCREKKKYSQRKLAILANISNTTVSRIESDSVTPDIESLKKIASALNISIETLLNVANDNCTNINKNIEFDELNEEFPEGVDVLMRAKEELTPAQKKKMIELMHLFLDSLEEK